MVYPESGDIFCRRTFALALSLLEPILLAYERRRIEIIDLIAARDPVGKQSCAQGLARSPRHNEA
jgi:hypothetical protein